MISTPQDAGFVTESPAQSFSYGLTVARPGRWYTLPIHSTDTLTVSGIDDFGHNNVIPISALLTTAVVIVLSKYLDVDSVGIWVSLYDRAHARPLILDVSPARQIKEVIDDAMLQLRITAAEGEQSAILTNVRPLPVVAAFTRATTNGCDSWQGASIHPEEAIIGIECVDRATSQEIQIHLREGAHGPWQGEQFAGHLGRVVKHWFQDPQRRIESLTLLDEVATEALTEGARGELRDYPLDQSVVDIFNTQAGRTPDKIALIGEDKGGSSVRMTYGEARALMDRMAGRLLNSGVSSGRVVGVLMTRSIIAPIAVLSIWRAGGIYLPLDPAYPPEYTRFVLENASASVLMIDDSVANHVIPSSVRIVKACDMENDLVVAPEFPDVASSEPAILMYTSGSTGRPKGVVHCRMQVINRLFWMWETYPFRVGDVLAQRCPITVMPSIWELLGGLLAGTPTAVIPDRAIRDPIALVRFLVHHRVSFITLTPTLLKLMLEARMRCDSWPGTLRLIVIGGETQAEGLYNEFRRLFPYVTMVEDFGATEVNTVLHMPLPPDLRTRFSSTGYRPIANVQAVLLDSRMHLTPLGVEGELCVAGPCVALGYLNLPEIAGARFVTLQLSCDSPGVRFYRTGDMGYRTPDGTIHMTGRRDDQVKINGMRVELGGIGRAIAGHQAIAECAVTATQDATGRTQLEATLVARTGQVADETAIRSFLGERLPEFMIPRKIVWTKALPRRPNGKLDRLALNRAHTPTQSRRQASEPIGDAQSDVAIAIRQYAARLAGVDSETLNPQSTFRDCGLDSVAIIELADLLSRALRRPVTPTSIFDYPTVARLAEFLAPSTGSLRGGEIPPGTAQSERSPAKTSERDLASRFADVAIIGMSGRFPGAEDVNQLWHNLCSGMNSISTTAPGRWEPEAVYDPDRSQKRRSYSKWGGFLLGADEFDPTFFGLSKVDAQSMDPQQRLSMMESWRALEDAGYTGIRLREATVGIFVGARESDYGSVIGKASRPPDASTLLGNDISLIASRIAYFCDLKGPSLVVDTACSSGLVAVHLACRSLVEGECTVALVGAVCVTNDPDFFVATSKLNVFSPTGKCRAFDAAADGFVHGEGVCFVVLKPLAAAITDHDNILAVILGSAMNQDGKTNGITAPSGAAQAALQENLYRKHGIDPETIGYVEAHGTGTPLGDPIEVLALARSFGRFTARRQFCAIGSIKTNIGHLTAAAGIAGLIKAVLCVRHGLLVPSLNYVTANPLIDFATTPFYVSTLRCVWQMPKGQPRRAAVNAFGIGGTNAHCVIEQAPELPEHDDNARPAYLVPVTAPTVHAAFRLVKALHVWIRHEGAQHQLRDVSYSMMVGRQVFEAGVVIVSVSMDDLQNTLGALLAGKCLSVAKEMAPSKRSTYLTKSDVFVTDPRLDAEIRSLIQADIVKTDSAGEYGSCISRIAELMTAGASADWRRIYVGETPHQLSLPGYVFQKERYWLDANPAIMATAPVFATQSPVDVSRAVVDEAATLLGLSPNEICHDRSLAEYGFDSIRAISLKYTIETLVDHAIPLDWLVGSASIQTILDRIGHGGLLLTAFIRGELDLENTTDDDLDELIRQMAAHEGTAHAQ
jgi:amino acid adenylation domain-containing protein